MRNIIACVLATAINILPQLDPALKASLEDGLPVAGDVAVLASGATEGALTALQSTLAGDGHHAQMRFETSQTITRRLAANEIPDVLIAQKATIDQTIADGRAVAASRA